MADETAAGTWPVLTLTQRRVLGVLVEKAKMTPDAYPLSLNALTTGCNQKSNRDPVMNLNDDQVEETLSGLQQTGLVTKITGGRVVRWRHNLYERWQVGKVDLAILTELLLRGPQTEGELRGRASRMEPLDEIEQLRQALRPLAERKLVVFLGPEGRRGTLITHGFHAPQELESLRAGAARAEEPAELARPAAPVSPALDADLRQARDEIAGLREHVERLDAAMRQVQAELQRLKESLGS